MEAEKDTNDPPAASEIVEQMMMLFDQHGIAYCHWKSNEHALAAVRGDTDLDLLFDDKQEVLVGELLKSIGFRLLRAVDYASYPGIIDFVALDARALRMIHVHAHFALRLGEKFVKSYRLPWERQLLETRSRHEQCPLFAAKPELEMMLLLIRVGLKVRLRDRVARFFGRWSPDNDFVREFVWLRERLNMSEFRSIATALLGDAYAKAIVDSVLAGPTSEAILRLRPYSKKTLRPYRTMSVATAYVSAMRRELQLYFRAFLRRKLTLPVPMRRTNPRGGIVIVLLGVDGSGKSTAVRELTRLLTRKLDVVNVYFGTGEGAGGVLKLLNKIRRPTGRANDAEKYSAPREGKSPGPIRRAAYMLWAFAAAQQKSAALKKMRKATGLGQIVLCDRYPQTQFAGIGDGPLLQQRDGKKFGLMHLVSRYEASVFNRFIATPPGLVLKLKVSAATAFARKPGQPSIEVLQRKIEIVEALRFGANAAVFEIDAERPLRDVVEDLAGHVWSQYR